MNIEINGQTYPCRFSTFHTQMGNDAIRIISDAPIAEDGFKLVGDNGAVVADYSDYKHLYREDGTIKEYTVEAEEILEAHGYVSGVPTSPIERQISALNQRVSAITPYTMSKEVGIQDKECIFDGNYKDGILNARVVTSRGEQIPCTTERTGDSIVVKFEELEDTATVTISIQ